MSRKTNATSYNTTLVTLGLISIPVIVIGSIVSTFTVYGAFLVILLGWLFYIIPALIAALRWHNNRMAITATNLLLGWTFLGWATALIWALTSNTDEGKGGKLTPRDAPRHFDTQI